MSRSRRAVQQHLPFTAAFALIQALRDPSGMLVRETDEPSSEYPSPKPLNFAPSHDSFRPDFMNTLSNEPLSEKKERGTHFGYGE